jgi:hypothetical protein
MKKPQTGKTLTRVVATKINKPKTIETKKAKSITSAPYENAKKQAGYGASKKDIEYYTKRNERSIPERSLSKNPLSVSVLKNKKGVVSSLIPASQKPSMLNKIENKLISKKKKAEGWTPRHK